MKYLLTTIVGLLIGAAAFGGYVYYEIATLPPDDFHEHADFAVFLNGERFDFEQDEYMSDLLPCDLEETSFIPAALAHGEISHGYANEREYLHLHGGDGSVVHVHKAGMTWGGFFRSLEMIFNDDAFVDDSGTVYEVDDANEFVYIVNGERVDSLVDREIRDLDRVLISYGAIDRDESEIMSEYGRISNDACLSSLSCEHRGVDSYYEACGVKQKLPWILEKFNYN